MSKNIKTNQLIQFNRFFKAYLTNLSVIIISIVITILGSKAILPEIFTYIGMLIMLADVVWFQKFVKKYRQSR